MKTKRVVTTESAAGGVQVKTEELAEGAALDDVKVLWGFDRVPDLPLTQGDLAPMEDAQGLIAPAGGIRVCLSTVSPEGDQPELEDLDFGEVEGVTVHESGNGMHRTDSIDMFVVLEGEITASVPKDDGSEEDVVLSAGDLLVQNGTFHRWRNHTDEPCTMMAFVVPTKRAATD